MIQYYKPEVVPMYDIKKPMWDSLLSHYPEQATVFHTQEWMKTLCEAFGWEPKYLTATIPETGSFAVAIPFMVDTRFGIENYLSMPFDTYGGVIGDKEYRSGMLNAFINLSGIGVRYHVDFDFDERHFVSGCQRTMESTEIAYISGYDDITDLHKDTRTAIRSAVKNDIEIDIARSGLDKISPQLVGAIHKHMVPSNLCVQYIATQRNGFTPIASSLFFVYGDTMTYWANTTLDLGRKTNANHLIMWNAIQYARSRGCTKLNLGASPPGATGLVAFKKSWGSKTHYYLKEQRASIPIRTVLKVREVINHG
jgi:hypothetical protein